MIANRRRGFTNLYAIFTTIVAVALLLVFVEIIRWVPGIDLAQGVNLWPYCLAIIVGMLSSSGVLRRQTHQLHDLPSGATVNMALKQTAIVAACVFALMFATKDRAVSRLFLGHYLVLLSCILAVSHGRVPRFFCRLLFPDNIRSLTLFVGRNTGPAELLPWIRNREHLGMQIVGYLADVSSLPEETVNMRYLGPTSGLETVLRTHNITQVILLDWLDDPMEMERLVEVCEAAGCRFLIHNGFASKFARNLISMEEGGQNFFIVQEEPLEDPVNRLLKRGLDIAVALPIVVLVLPPLTVWIWLMQRFQAPGSVMFIRPRCGRQRHEFLMFKYRSMYDAEPIDSTKQATVGDDRIYPFGRFLRSRSLDEFPQFINVLKGEMTLVGPRPHLPGHDDEFSRIDRTYRIRALVKPGMTGLAQIRGFRGEITNPEKLRQRVYWDLYYLTNWTLWMDLRIIARTALQVFVPPKSAY